MTTSVPTTRPPYGGGWHSWHDGVLYGAFAHRYVEVELWRRGWRQTELVDPMRLHPQFNVANLWWRPAGPKRDMEAYYRALFG